MEDELSNYLSALDRDSCYRVDAVLKQGPPGDHRARLLRGREERRRAGPFVRKYLAPGLGGAYERIHAAQRDGARLSHLPRIVECHRQDERLVVVMEHVAGETLAEAVASATDRLDLVRRVFPDLCDAVSELHELFDPPIIHRDLKPGNVMVSAGGVTLIDLGIARTWREGGEQIPPTLARAPTPRPSSLALARPMSRATSTPWACCSSSASWAATPWRRTASAALRGSACPSLCAPSSLRRPSSTPPGASRPSASSRMPCSPPCPQHRGEKDQQLEPPTFEVPRRGASALLARVPRWLGVAWDLCVLGACAIMLMGCVMAIADPTPRERRVAHVVSRLLLPGLHGAARHRRLLPNARPTPLRRVVPALARLTVRRELRVGLLVILGLFAAWVVASLIALV